MTFRIVILTKDVFDEDGGNRVLDIFESSNFTAINFIKFVKRRLSKSDPGKEVLMQLYDVEAAKMLHNARWIVVPNYQG